MLYTYIDCVSMWWLIVYIYIYIYQHINNMVFTEQVFEIGFADFEAF